MHMHSCTYMRTHMQTCEQTDTHRHTGTCTNTHTPHAHAHTHILFLFPLQVDNALALVELGIEYQVPGLEVVHHDFQTLHTLVYHCHVDPTLSLPHLRRMSNLEKVQAMMRKVRGNGRNSRHLIIGFTPHWGWGQPQLQPSSSSLVSEWHPMPGRRELSHHKHSMYTAVAVTIHCCQLRRMVGKACVHLALCLSASLCCIVKWSNGTTTPPLVSPPLPPCTTTPPHWCPRPFLPAG